MSLHDPGASWSKRRPLASRVVLYGVLAVFLVVAVGLSLRTAPAPAFDAEWSRIDYEAHEDVRRLRDLVRIDTTSDTGREIDAARYLAGILEGAGIEVEIESLEGSKANLWAIVEGESREALVLHNHLDVDPVRRPEAWTAPPFEGRIDPPWIIGRGVFDMKSITVAQLAAVLHVQERAVATGRRPHRSLVFLATSSEETGSDPGTRRILRHRPELAGRFWAVLTEGGVVEATWTGEVKYWGTSFAQKQFLEATATAGSAARLERLRRDLDEAREAAKPAAGLAPEVRAFAAAYAPSRQHPDYRAALLTPERVQTEPELFDALPDLLKSLFRNEAHPFPVEPAPGGGFAMRIVLHVLPGLDADAVAAELLPPELLDGVEISIHERRGAAHGSPLDHPAYLGLTDTVRRHVGLDRDRVGPYLLTRHANDARFFRRHGIASWGFTPFAFLAVDSMTVAGPNEKIALPAFLDGVKLYRQVVHDLVVAPEAAAEPPVASAVGDASGAGE